MGISIGHDGNQRLCVGQLPGRARPSLYVWDPMSIQTLASFKSEDAAHEVERFFRAMDGKRIVFEEDV